MAAAAGIPPSELSANVELASIIVRAVIAESVASNDGAVTNNTAAIIGGVLGAVTVAAIIVASLAYMRNARSTAAPTAAASTGTAAPPAAAVDTPAALTAQPAQVEIALTDDAPVASTPFATMAPTVGDATAVEVNVLPATSTTGTGAPDAAPDATPVIVGPESAVVPEWN